MNTVRSRIGAAGFRSIMWLSQVVRVFSRQPQNREFVLRINDSAEKIGLQKKKLAVEHHVEQQNVIHGSVQLWVAQAVDKKRAPLNCIDPLIKQVPYADIPKEQVILPLREHHEHYSRQAVPPSMLVPEVY